MRLNKKTKNILIRRIVFTLGILLIIRAGTFLPVPGIDHRDLAFYLQSHSITRNVVSTFSGKNTFIIGLFTLNIFPYINASILMQLILAISPKLSKLQKEGDLSGRRYINRLTRLLTLMWAVIQSASLSLYLKQVLFNWNYVLAFDIVIWLTTGAMIVLWLSELITDYGLGNGASLLIYINIISSFPNLVGTVFKENQDTLTILPKISIVLLTLLVLYGIVFLQESMRIIPLISSKQLNQNYSQVSVEDDMYLPLRLNQAGVMPIILTTAILVIPNYLANLGLLPQINFLPSFVYWISYFVLVLLFSSFYSRIVINPKDLSDQLQRMAVTIPGIRPGLQTTFYLKQIMNRVALLGATMLATLAIVPNFLGSVLNITSLNSLSTTSLLILAGVVSDLIREVRNIYYSNVYNNLDN